LEADVSNGLTRWHVIIGATAIGAATIGGGATLLATADARAALLGFFKRSLPGVAIDTPSANGCINAFISRWSTMNHRIVSTLWQTVGVEMMAETNSKFEIASRLALTQFLVNSNFFQVTDPRAEPIVYVGQPSNAGCTNPFANLDPP
jgi:hypothetical protein